jgi:ribosomal protein S18 acetylase RimI-like enzyme
MGIEIRQGQASDLDSLKTVDSYFAAGHPERAKEIEHWLRTGEAHVAICDGNLCAYAALGEQFGRPFIHMLMVAEDNRGMGIGNRLVAYLEELIRGPEIWTSTNLSNQPMQRLLAARKFTLTGFIDNLDPGDPELFYFKRLKR